MSCNPFELAILSHLIPCPHSQSPMGTGVTHVVVVVLGVGVVVSLVVGVPPVPGGGVPPVPVSSWPSCNVHPVLYFFRFSVNNSSLRDYLTLQVRHFSLVSTQFPFPSHFGLSTMTLLLQPLAILGRPRRKRRTKKGKPCIAKGPAGSD